MSAQQLTAEEIYFKETGKEATFQSNPIDYPYEREYNRDYIWWLEKWIEFYKK